MLRGSLPGGPPQSRPPTIRGLLVISGVDNQSRTISFGVFVTSAPSTHSIPTSIGLNFNVLLINGQTAQSFLAVQGSGTGTITINSLSATGAAGTFSFTALAVPGTGASGSPPGFGSASINVTCIPRSAA